MAITEKRDVLFLCQFFYPEHNSSATLPFDTAKYLAAHGLSVAAMCGFPKEYSNASNVPLTETVEGVDIKRLKYSQLRRTNVIGRLINYFSFTFNAWLNQRYLKNFKCVVVYSNPPILPYIPIVAKKKYGTKFVFVSYDVYPEVAFASKILPSDSMISKLMKQLNHRLYRTVDKVVSLTDEMKEFLLENRSELSRDRVITIANWAHENKLIANHESYARFGYRDNQFVVSYFGNMGTCQDMDTLMGAAQRLKDDDRVCFLIVGHGNKINEIKKVAVGLPNVQVLDFLTGADFEQAVAVTSVSVVSLQNGLKGMCAPSKYYSYLQGGKPIVAVAEKDSYLCREVEDEQIGYAVELGDVNRMTEVLIHMQDDRRSCAEMGERAYRLYEDKYSYEIAMKKYEEAIRSII